MRPPLLLSLAAPLSAACSTTPQATPIDASVADGPAPDAVTAEGGPLAPGSFVEIGPCDAGSRPSTTCTRVSVACPDTISLVASVRVTAPAGAPRGTVVLGTGGAGQAFFDDTVPNGKPLEDDLADAGYVLVDRFWEDPGWFLGDAGLHAASCRYATLLRWVDDRHHAPSTPLCALGISGGAYEIGYALARWDGADRLTGALLLSGPAVTNLAEVCPSDAPPSWLDGGCQALAAKYDASCGPAQLCLLSDSGATAVVDESWTPNHPCSDPADPRLPDLAMDGVIAPGSRLSYPATKFRMLVGDQECAVPVLLYYDAIQSDRALQVVPGTGHGVTQTDSGIVATREAFLAACGPF